MFLVLLDLSAAFDTLDHSRLKARLERKFGVSDSALRWLESYISERQQAVTIKGIGSEKRTLAYGVPQGSVLGPELFMDYVAPLSSLIQSFGVNFHGYTDDTQIYVPFVPGQKEDSARDKIQECIAAVKSWMAQNWFKLNDDKTEFIIIESPRNLKKVVTEYIVVGDHKSKQVRNIGAIFDTSATMEAQVVRTGSDHMVSPVLDQQNTPLRYHTANSLCHPCICYIPTRPE